jgi:hypothetical protein
MTRRHDTADESTTTDRDLLAPSPSAGWRVVYPIMGVAL